MLSATKADRLATSLSRYVPEAEDAPLLDELRTYLDQRLTALEHDFAGTPSPSPAVPAPASASPLPAPSPVPPDSSLFTLHSTLPLPLPRPAPPIHHSSLVICHSSLFPLPSSLPRPAPPILHSSLFTLHSSLPRPAQPHSSFFILPSSFPRPAPPIRHSLSNPVGSRSS